MNRSDHQLDALAASVEILSEQTKLTRAAIKDLMKVVRHKIVAREMPYSDADRTALKLRGFKPSTIDDYWILLGPKGAR